MTRHSPDRRRFLAAGAGASAAGLLGLGLGGCSERSPADDAAPPRSSASGLVPDPTDVLVSRWGADPWTRGAWTSVRPGTGPDPRAALAAPVADRLFFAGEATAASAPGTVQGAYLDGQRAADAVAARYPAGAQVVVVGAGIAGLAAARRWDDRLGRAATVLEGRERLGGRISTDRSWAGGVPIEQGALWLYGEGNLVSELAGSYGKQARVVERYDRQLRAGGEVVATDATRSADLQLQELLELTAAQALVLPPGSSLADGLDPAWAQLEQAHPALDGAARELVELGVATEWLQPRAADAADLSLNRFQERDGSGDRAVVPTGLDQVVATLAQDMDVRLSRPAVSVVWSPDGVRVVSSGGTIDAAAVILTVPVGVLRSGQPTFAPPLPAATQAAIAALDPGRYEQCYLRFPHRFWGDAAVIDVASGEPGRWCRFFDLSHPLGEPVLLGVNAGEDAARLDLLTDRQVVDEAVAALRDAFR